MNGLERYIEAKRKQEKLMLSIRHNITIIALLAERAKGNIVTLNKGDSDVYSI